jgi:hypothetical protein
MIVGNKAEQYREVVVSTVIGLFAHQGALSVPTLSAARSAAH